MESVISYADWGLTSYSEAYEKQKALFENTILKKNQGEKPENTLIFCEHPHVITIGKNGLFSNLLFSEQMLKEKQVELFHVDRGGDITYHGQGQLVGYPIFDLESFKLGLKDYIFRMEECIIKLLETYDIKSERLEGATGVWIDTDKPGKTRKICAIGVRSSRYVTMHGFALNINTDLSYFQLINPCGFIDKGVTSMAVELQKDVDFEEVKEKLLKLFLEYFQ